MEKRLNQAELSRELGFVKSYISKLVKDGVIKLGDDKRTTLEEAKKSIAEHSDPQKDYNRKANKITEEDKKILSNFDGDLTKDVFNLSYADARTRNEQIDILMNIIKLEKEKGKLVAIEQVKSNAFEIGKKLKEGLLNIPDRICDFCAVESDPIKIHDMMTKEIKQVLEEISEDLKK